MKFYGFLLFILSIVFLSSCGEDRTYEYKAKRADDIWIYQTMKQNYLWKDNMQDSTKDAFFASPKNFIPKMAFKGNKVFRADIFSYAEMMDTEATTSNYLDETSKYGFDFELIKNPTNSKENNYTYARILFVLPNSPASEAGLKRGDWISKIGEIHVTENNYGYLMQGKAATFTVENLVRDADTLMWKNKKEISITASRNTENNPFYVDTLYNVNGMKIAYMVYNRFSTGPNNGENDTEYLDEMKQIFSKFKNDAPDAFILDLRYNPGGYLTCAQQMASMLAPESALGKTFAKVIYNSNNSGKNATYNFIEGLTPYNLNLKKIYILTSSFTASAAESLIYSLKPYMGNDNVITIGETTVGNNIVLGSYTKPDANFVLHLAVAYIENADKTVNYLSGITPSYEISERTYYDTLLPLGDVNELFLKNTISLITTGTMPDVATGSNE